MLRATLSYNRPLIRRAMFCFWWRTTGPGFFVAIGLMAMGFTSLLWHGDTSWLVGILGCTLALGLVFPILLFGVHYRHSLRRFEAMGPPVGTLEVSQASLSLSSLGGSATLPWSRITEIWRFRTCWLLLFSKAQFVTLPLADLGTETRAFILERVRSCGGKIR
jgi:YcxB-like protein